MVTQRMHEAVKPIGLVVMLLMGVGLMVTACSADAWRGGGGTANPYKNECRSEGCAF